jgi:radical SAM superfamily enzyme YgiQ (UPF0313 family)
MKISFVIADHEEIPPTVLKWEWGGLFHFGVSQLSSCLKQENHDTSLIHIVRELNRDEFISLVKEHAPDLLAFTSMSGVFPYIARLASWAKEETDIPTICGGVHPTLDTEEVIQQEGIDIACIGEGEYPLIELCDRLERGIDFLDIPNLWVKRNGEAYRNPPRPLIEDLDTLPDFDREIYDFENLRTVKVLKMAYMMCSRGCPFDCTFCCNHLIKTKYPNSGNYVRFRSPERVVAECKAVLERYPTIKVFRFWDDVLTLKKPWAREFLDLYGKEIGVPFHCYEKIRTLTRDRVKWLKKAGCMEVSLGIQSGNETIREEVLNRKMSDREILESAMWLHEERIRIQTENILGFPGENKERVLDTVKINAQINPVMVKIYMFNPFKYTRLYDYCKKMGYLRNDRPFPKNLFDGPNLKLPTITDEEIRFCSNYFLIMMLDYQACYLKFPRGVRYLDAVFTARCLPHTLLNRFFDRFLAKRLKQNYFLFRMERKWKFLHLAFLLPLGMFIQTVRTIAQAFQTDDIRNSGPKSSLSPPH